MRIIENILLTAASVAAFYYLVLPEIQGLWWDLLEGLPL
jgi:hypothetical protein